jgi:uroporphyrinogen III methyltransferase / synthase
MNIPEAKSAKLPLTGKTVVVTRARAQADEFVAELERFGAHVVVCPTIEIKPLENYERLDEAIEHLYGYDWLIFTSVNGVDHFFERLRQQQRDAHELDEIRVCAIGDATAERLRSLQVHVDVVPAEFKAEGVYAALASFVGGEEALGGLNILIPRASVARDFLPQALEHAGARVDVVPAYSTCLPDGLDKGHVAAMLAGDADCIAFTSSSTVRNLGLLFDTQDLSGPLTNVAVACIGDITSVTAKEYGLTVHIQPAEFTVPTLARAIAEYFASS